MRSVLAAAVAVLTWAALPAPASATLSLTTGDGLRLSLAEDGTVTGVGIAGRGLPQLERKGGFSLRSVGGTPNTLPNGGFETDVNRDGVPDGWTLFGSPRRPALDGTIAHRGERSVRLQRDAGGDGGTLSRTILVEPETDYVLAAWMRSQDVKPSVATSKLSVFRLRVEQLSSTGAVLATALGSAYSDTAAWHRQFVGFQTEPAATRVRVGVLFMGGSGTGWIDDLSLRRLFQPGVTPVRGEVSQGPGGVLEQEASIPGQGLQFQATYTAAPDHIAVQGSVEGQTSADRGFQIAFTLPVDARGWRWGEYARQERSIVQGRYAYVTERGQQSTSRYPFGVLSTIHDQRASLSLAMPLSDPRIARLEYDTERGFSIVFDLGLSPDATRLGPRATFSFVIYRSDPSWGFRAATARYQRIFGSDFERRTEPAREGIWYFEASTDKLADSYRDYGMGWNVLALGKAPAQGFATWGRRQVTWDNERDIYAFAYNHHWAYYSLRPSRTSVPPYSEVLAGLRETAALEGEDSLTVRRREEAAAALRSTARDVNGRLLYEPYSRYLAFYQNLDDLPGTALDWEGAVQKHQVGRALAEAAAQGGHLDGIHLDSTSGMKRWGAADDHDRRHWAATTVPLTFSYRSGHVVERGVLANHGHIQRFAAWLRGQGLLLSANFNAGEGGVAGWMGADRIDIFGIERGLPERASPTEGTTSDHFAMLKRTLAYQRPVSTYDPRLGQPGTSLAEIRRRLQQNLFYGFFAGGPVTDAFLADERRQVYARYTPLFRRLAAAGWEPVTYARSSDREVWVERFGSAEADDLCFTLRNETAVPRDYTLTIDLRATGGSGVTAVRAVERVVGEVLAVELDTDRQQARIRASIPPGVTRLITLDLTVAP